MQSAPTEHRRASENGTCTPVCQLPGFFLRHAPGASARPNTPLLGRRRSRTPPGWMHLPVVEPIRAWGLLGRCPTWDTCPASIDTANTQDMVRGPLAPQPGTPVHPRSYPRSILLESPKTALATTEDYHDAYALVVWVWRLSSSPRRVGPLALRAGPPLSPTGRAPTATAPDATIITIQTP